MTDPKTRNQNPRSTSLSTCDECGGEVFVRTRYWMGSVRTYAIKCLAPDCRYVRPASYQGVTPFEPYFDRSDAVTREVTSGA